jgi:2,3-bisphosphoglycerate-independent phosphoglycerate mutase
LALKEGSKIVLLVLDGLGDLPAPDKGGRTPLEAASTPNLDRLAPAAAMGRILPVAPGITPGSGPGHLALFGFDPVATEVGRGMLEALGAGLALEPGDVAARANFCTVDGSGTVTDRRAGRISSETCAHLVSKLKGALPKIEDVQVILEAGKGHRFVAVLRGPGLAEGVGDADPHKEGHPIPAVRAHVPAAEKTARVVNALVSEARRILAAESPANGILMRGISARPRFRTFAERFQLRAAAVAAYPMYRGVAQLAGMEILATGETIVDEFATVTANWDRFDFFFVHFKATDMAGEDGNFDAKVRAVEEADRALPALLGKNPGVLCVTGDHSTPVPVRGHSWHPVPVLIAAPYCGRDGHDRFHERNARSGSLGVFESRHLMSLLLANAGRLDKFGA